MTVIPARTPALRRLATILLATALFATVGAPAAVAAEVTAATPAPSPSASGSVALTLAPVGEGVVRSGEGLSVSVRIDNGTTAATAAARVTLAVGDTAIPDRAGLTTWLGGGAAPGALSSAAAVDMPVVAAGTAESRGITLAATDPALAARAPGVYPLLATYADAAGTTSSTSVMIVPDPAAAAAPVGVIVPITAPATGTGLLTAAQLSDLTATGGSLADQLDAVSGTAAILAVDPAIPAAIRVLGTAAPATASAWLERLDALPNSRFALQFGDADVAAQLQAGLSAPEQPTSLQTYMSPSNFTARPGATAAPTATPTPGSTVVYPTLDELLDIGGDVEPAQAYWPRSGTAGSSVLDALAANDPGAITIVPSTTLAASAGAASAGGARMTAGAAGVLAYDSDVSAALRQASVTDASVVRGAPLTAATAYLTFATEAAAGRPVLVTVDRAADRSSVALGAAISAALQAPGVTAVDLASLGAAQPEPAQPIDVAPDTGATDAATALFADEGRIASFATIIEDPSLLTGPQRAESLQLLGNAWRDAPDEWQAALASHSAATLATLDAVGILAPTTIQLLSSEAPLQFWVRNDLPYPVDVVLHASPDDLRLDVQRETVVTDATPRSNTRVEVPVTARIGSGQVYVDLQLRSATGEAIGAAQRADVTVRADWEGIGVTALLIVIAALVVFGLVRTVLRRRRARRETAGPLGDNARVADAPGDAPTDADPHGSS